MMELQFLVAKCSRAPPRKIALIFLKNIMFLLSNCWSLYTIFYNKADHYVFLVQLTEVVYSTIWQNVIFLLSNYLSLYTMFYNMSQYYVHKIASTSSSSFISFLVKHHLPLLKYISIYLYLKSLGLRVDGEKMDYGVFEK